MTRAILVLVVMFAGSAWAQKSSNPEAQAHLSRAKAHFDLQEYAAAEVELKEAYRLDSKPEILYAIAQTQRRRGDCVQAITSYKNFLRSDPKPDQAKLANDNITSCEAELEDVRKKKEDARRKAAAQRSGPTPTPGTGLVRVIPAASSGVQWTRNWLGHGLVAAGAISVIGGVIVARGGQARIDKLNDAQFYDDFVASSRDIASAESTRTTGLVLAGAGTAVVAAGIIAYVVRSPDRELPVKVAIGARGASVGWAW